MPAETDYTMLVEEVGLGLAHNPVRREKTLTERDIVTYLAHSGVTEQRASEQMRTLRKSRPCTSTKDSGAGGG